MVPTRMNRYTISWNSVSCWSPRGQYLFLFATAQRAGVIKLNKDHCNICPSGISEIEHFLGL